MEPSSKNLSENLFKKHQHAEETSSLIGYLSESQALLEENQQRTKSAWYRALRRMQWIWQGLDPIEIESVLARIASSGNKHNHPDWLDTVAGYRPGNWAYEWTQQGVSHQKKASLKEGEAASDELYLASLCFSVASYPHLKGDNLSIQAQILVNKVYKEAMELSPYVTKALEIPYKNNKIMATLHVPHTEKSLPIVMVSAGIDNLQTDMWRLFRDYLAKHNIGLLTVDMPGIGANAHWTLTEDSSYLHQAVLNELPNIPWVDHHNVGLLGFRFGGNVMARLSFIEQDKVKACVALGAPIHDLLSSSEKFGMMPKMYLDALASRMGKKSVDIFSFSKQVRAWSLKSQGLLAGRATPVPILALGLEGDPVGSKKDNQSLAMFSQGGKCLELKTKSLSQGYDQALTSAVDWLKSALNK
ncbi:esterase FrsA [Vibrio gangliei]|uniref:esterase FrsA n=1 Tax=Vibrio gangliei TaxID=2077090 RepID=UPI000D01AF8F|nr:esterase FrsA [Vibrio gangliei]